MGGAKSNLVMLPLAFLTCVQLSKRVSLLQNDLSSPTRNRKRKVYCFVCMILYLPACSSNNDVHVTCA